LYRLLYNLKDNNQTAKLLTKFSVKDNSGYGLLNILSSTHCSRIYEIKGVGHLIQRNDNRMLLYP